MIFLVGLGKFLLGKHHYDDQIGLFLLWVGILFVSVYEEVLHHQAYYQLEGIQIDTSWLVFLFFVGRYRAAIASRAIFLGPRNK